MQHRTKARPLLRSINALLAASPRDGSRGAPMGDPGYARCDNFSRMRCERLRMLDGDYGPDGTYWGCGSRARGYMYVCFNGATDDYGVAGGFIKYYRATSRADAIAQCLVGYPNLIFLRANYA